MQALQAWAQSFSISIVVWNLFFRTFPLEGVGITNYLVSDAFPLISGFTLTNASVFGIPESLKLQDRTAIRLDWQRWLAAISLRAANPSSEEDEDFKNDHDGGYQRSELVAARIDVLE